MFPLLALLFTAAEARPTCIPLTGAQQHACARLDQILLQYPDQCSISTWLTPHCSACGECEDANQRFFSDLDFEAFEWEGHEKTATTFSSMNMNWRRVTVSSASINTNVQIGVQLANGGRLTQAYTTSFLSQLSNARFQGVAVSSSIAQNTANTFSNAFSSNSMSISCPGRSGSSVALYQYVIEGQHQGGRDVLSTTLFRCQYTSSTFQAPQCPFQACGSLSSNPNCQSAGCSAWRR